MDNSTITSANSVFTLVVAGLFPAPVQLRGYASDKAFTTEAVDLAEVQMGVDGRMTAGFVPNPVKQTVTLQADSPSKDIFTAMIQAMKTAREVFYISGSIALPSTGESFTLTRGILTNAKQIPDAQKVLQPVDYVWSFRCSGTVHRHADGRWASSRDAVRYVQCFDVGGSRPANAGSTACSRDQNDAPVHREGWYLSTHERSG
jgi:hypothetical protein